MPMAKMVLRYWYEWMSESPFVPGNAAAVAKYGMGPVDMHALPLSDEVAAEVMGMCEWWLEAVGYDYTLATSEWTKADFEEFWAESDKLLARVREDLGDAYEVIDVIDRAILTAEAPIADLP